LTGKVVFLALGVVLFFIIYYCPPWPDAIDPKGTFCADKRSKGALAVLPGRHLVDFEVLPIGVTVLP